MDYDLKMVNDHLVQVAQAVARLDRKTDFILKHLNLEFVDEPQSGIPDELAVVYTLVQMGKKIDAIKEYRLRTGVGLEQAKKAVEDIELGLKQG